MICDAALLLRGVNSNAELHDVFAYAHFLVQRDGRLIVIGLNINAQAPRLLAISSKYSINAGPHPGADAGPPQPDHKYRFLYIPAGT